jgi:hypothetical protein
MGAAILVAMTQEETDKLLASVQPADAALAMAASGELTKRADDALAKVAELTTARALQKRVDELLAQPEPAKGVVKVIEKKGRRAHDVVDDLDELDRPERARLRPQGDEGGAAPRPRDRLPGSNSHDPSPTHFPTRYGVDE